MSENVEQLKAELHAFKKNNEELIQRHNAAISSWDEERERALREANRVLEWQEKHEGLERENAALKKDKEMLEMERCECLRTMDLALNNNAGLRELVNESYQFFRFGHEDLEFWKKGIDDWCERAERLGFKKEPQP